MKNCAHAKILSTKVIFSDFWNATLVADIYEHVLNSPTLQCPWKRPAMIGLTTHIQISV